MTIIWYGKRGSAVPTGFQGAFCTEKPLLWYETTGDDIRRASESGIGIFRTIAETIYNHYENILNVFDNRSTNASAESFNAKIKAFRRQIRGVVDVKYFLFRLCKIYA